MKKFFLLIFILSTTIRSYSQSEYEPINIKFNRIYYFAPGNEFSQTVSKITKTSTYITIDFNLNTVSILTYYSNPPTESSYEIKSIDNSLENIYKFTCQASNYAEVIIEYNLLKGIITRKIPHNGISHKYYNE